jgi:hypothetical protein
VFRNLTGIGEPAPAGGFGAHEPGLSGEPGPGMSGEPGPGAAADGLAAQGDTAFAGGRMPGSFPMAGAGAAGGQGEAERSSQYWASEDAATWGPGLSPGTGGPDAAAGDGMGWMMPGGGAGRGQDRERSRLAWLGEDDDFWGTGDPAVPPVIGG